MLCNPVAEPKGDEPEGSATGVALGVDWRLPVEPEGLLVTSTAALRSLHRTGGFTETEKYSSTKSVGLVEGNPFG
jgi:hypothetical protein